MHRSKLLISLFVTVLFVKESQGANPRPPRIAGRQFTSIHHALGIARSMRRALEGAFSPETANRGTTPGSTKSAGHCAITAAILYDLYGGRLVSSSEPGTSHWFNRFSVDGQEHDFDLTGDQFGHRPIRIVQAGHLHEGTKERQFYELNADTLRRAAVLSRRIAEGQTDFANDHRQSLEFTALDFDKIADSMR